MHTPLNSLLAAILLARTLASFCVPQTIGTCVLIWETNNGPPLATTNPLDIVVPLWAHVYIYSPTCLGWGQELDAINAIQDIMKVYAWGLNLSRPLLLSAENAPEEGWATPIFEYGGKYYDYNSCKCKVDITMHTFQCLCPFACLTDKETGVV